MALGASFVSNWGGKILGLELGGVTVNHSFCNCNLRQLIISELTESTVGERWMYVLKN